MVDRAKPVSISRRARGRPRAWNDQTKQITIKTLDRAVALLEYLSIHQGKTLTGLANELGQSPATVYRVLVTLQARGLVEFDPAEQIWNIGPGAFLIGARFLQRTSLVERARPILRRLMEKTGETANLGIENKGAVLFVSQVETSASIRAFFPPGSLSPMHASGIGKALLAHMDPERLDGWFRVQTREVFTASTIADRDALQAELARVRANGFAVDNEEKNAGMRCIAAPVFDMNREAVAGISASGPANRIRSEKIAVLSEHVIDAAAQLSLAIGGTRA